MRRRKLVRWPTWAALAGAALAVHVYGLYRPDGPPPNQWLPHLDKAQHAIGFALPLLLVLLTLRTRARSRDERLSATAVGVTAGAFGVHAILSEVIQGAFYLSRTGDPRDVAADAAGVLLGVAGFVLATRRGPAESDALGIRAAA